MVDDIVWVTKEETKDYPVVHPPFRIISDDYTLIKQEESMSGKYKGAAYLVEHKLIDYSGSIIIPFTSGKPCYGFKMHTDKKAAINYMKHNHTLFVKLMLKYPEYFI